MRMIAFFFVGIFIALQASGQTASSILDRKLDVSFKNERLTTVLTRIGQSANFSFSYNAAIISNDDVISIEKTNATVRDILNEVFKGSMTYKEKGNYLILNRVTVKAPKSNTTSMIISGYVEDWFTNDRIVEASVYEKGSLNSTVTDPFGFFRLKVDMKDNQPVSVAISKKDFIDTTLVITESGNQYYHVSLKRTRPLSPPEVVETRPTNDSLAVERQVDSVLVGDPQTDREEVPMPYSSSPNVENIRDTLYRDVQVSILPFVGTNGGMSGNVINEYSINFLGGYSLGTRQIELGFITNIDRGDVSFLQLAGVGNIVGGDVIGIQGSGFFNLNGGETKAIQATGFSNVNFGDFQGVQISGLANINLESADGVMAAGAFNYSNGRSVGFAVAGLANVHVGDFKGPQIAGFTNINSGGTLKGSQISGFLNYGNKVQGTQIGFLNVADSLTGVPVGFLSIVKHGYHQLEVSADEVFYTNLAFRSGVRKFYNIIYAGIQPRTVNQTGTDPVWTFGYGLGSARRITRWLHLNIDLTSQQVNKGGFTTALSSLNKLQLGFDFRLARGLSIYAGGTLNAYLTKTTYTDYPTLFTDYTPTLFYNGTVGGDVNMKVWFGGKVALRFF